MATKTRSDLPEGSPAIIFKGTVKKIKSATMKEVPISDRTAVVRVDQVIEAPRTFAHCGGQDITVELAGKKKVSVGEQFIFHANSWIFGDSIAVRDTRTSHQRAFGSNEPRRRTHRTEKKPAIAETPQCGGPGGVGQSRRSHYSARARSGHSRGERAQEACERARSEVAAGGDCCG